ncbi:hypothetical protein NQ314_000311 [Rhamnusium bicolor]|uniref:Uncharacterized protein n=1 Tax=Rhamnusium bicolor TaxID=1586634 RepID=A0AAV8ZYM1_9CUCU|nr:hypothetical protein NQ314_000311 [Rhamnusium bicolor]
MTSLAKPKRAKKEITTSSSDSKASIEMSNCSSDSDIDLTEDCELECLLDDEEIAVGDFILVKSSTKKEDCSLCWLCSRYN